MRWKTLLRIWVLSFLLLAPTVIAAETMANDKAADIKRLLQLTNTEKTALAAAQKSFAAYLEAFKSYNPQYKIGEKEINDLWGIAFKVMESKMWTPDGFMVRMVSLYDKYFNHAEIKELITIYESPVMKKATSLAPNMSQEGWDIGVQWWEEVVGPAVEDMFDKYIKENIAP